MADVLSLKESVLVYLDRSGGLMKLAKDCKQFNGKPDVCEMKNCVNVSSLKLASKAKLLTVSPSFPDPQQIEAVYRFCVTVNPSDVIEVDPVLGDFILRYPLKATALFQSVSEN